MVMQTVAQPVTANVIPGAGVPKLWSKVISDAEAVGSVELATLLQSYLVQKAETQWGIFDSSNQPVITSGRVRALGIRKERTSSDAPLENGAFLTYNKVKHPGDVFVEMLCDGTSMSLGNLGGISGLLAVSGISGPSMEQKVREDFTKKLDALCDDLNLYVVTTPEQRYSNMNIMGYDMQRETRRGITLLSAVVRMREIRIEAKSTSAPTKTPAGASKQIGGNVQLQDSEYNAVTPAGVF